MTSSGVPNFPELVAVRLMGGALISQHEGRVIPTQDWMLNVAAANPKFLKEQIQFIADTKKTRDTILGIVDQCLNLPRGMCVFNFLLIKHCSFASFIVVKMLSHGS